MKLHQFHQCFPADGQTQGSRSLVTANPGRFSFQTFHPTLHVAPSTCSFPANDSFAHLTTSTKLCNDYSAQIPTDLNKYVHQLGRTFTTAALAKQTIVTDSLCSPSLPNRQADHVPPPCLQITWKQLFRAICFPGCKSLLQKGLFDYLKHTRNGLTSTRSQVTAVSKTVTCSSTRNKKRDMGAIAGSRGSSVGHL